MNSLRRFLPTLTLTSALLLTSTMSAASQLIYIGTYTPKDGASRGIYAVRLDTVTATLSEPVLAAAAASPTFLALHPNGQILYALSETDTVQGKPGGGAASFQIEATAGKLTPLDLQSTGGIACAHLGLNPAAQTLVLASYMGSGHLLSPPPGRPDRARCEHAAVDGAAGTQQATAGQTPSPLGHLLTGQPFRVCLRPRTR